MKSTPEVAVEPALQLQREVRRLKAYVAFLTASLVLLVASGFVPQHGRRKLGEIDVERINVVEKDGRLRMVISNEERQHPGIANGKPIHRDGPRPPGIIFFNPHGDEMGGLIFGENGETGHFGSLTFDKVRGDQTIGFRHLEGDNGKYQSGLEMWQQPYISSDVAMAKYQAASQIKDETARKAAIQALLDANLLTTRRLLLGKLRDDSVVLTLADIKGRPRINIQVQADGTPTLDFLDEKGKVTYSLPGTAAESRK